MCDTASELYNQLLGIYFDEYYDFSDTRRKKMDSKYDPDELGLSAYDYEN